MKINNRIISRLLVIAMTVTVMIGILSVSVLAYSPYQEFNSTVYVGEYIKMPSTGIRNDYDRAHEKYEFSKPSAVLVDGNAPPDKDESFYRGYRGYFQFLEPGNHTLTVRWHIYDGQSMSDSGVYTYKYKVLERTESTGNVCISESWKFTAGQAFPGFSNDRKSDSDVPVSCKNAFFDYKGKRYRIGDIIPDELANQEIDLILHVYPVGSKAFSSSYNYSEWSPTYNMVFLSGKRVPQIDVEVFTGPGLHGSLMKIRTKVKVLPYSGGRTKQSDPVKVNYTGNFASGEAFPEFTVGEKEFYYVNDVWFELNGAGCRPGEIIPEQYAGKEVSVNVSLSAKAGMSFDYNGNASDIWVPALNSVSLNGERIPRKDTSVFAYKKGDTLQFSFPVTIGGAVKEIKITDLDVPTHGHTLDRTATASVGTVTAVKYEMYRKEINEVSKGDSIGVGVLVKLPKGFTFANGSYALWNGQKSETRIRTASMGTDEYLYVFPVTVGVFSEQAYINSGSVYFTGDAMLKVGARVPSGNYIDSDDNGIIYGEPIWTPADKTFKSGTTYTVKIPMELEPEYVWADDLKTNNNFSIESKDAALVIEGETTGGKQKFETKKFITATFKPEDIEGQPGEKYFDLKLSYSKTDFDLKVDDKATVTAMTNIDNTLAKDLKIQWFSATSKTNGTGIPVKGADSLTLTIPTDTTGTKYYYCEVSCVMMGEKSRLPNPPDPIKVTVRSKNLDGNKYKLSSSEDTKQYVVINDSNKDFSFEVNTENASPNIRFRWYRCDKNGKNLDNNVLGNGRALLIYGIKDEDMYETFYYKCVADDNGDEQSLVFSCLLLPEDKELPFKDIATSDPYYGSVWYVNNHTPLLMNGVSADSFDPQGNLTRAAIVTVLYRLEGSPTMAASNEFYDVPAGQWYSDAVAWAVKYGITNGYGDGRFGPNDPITREQLATFLHRYAKSHKLNVSASGKLTQSDASRVDSWALDAMTWAYSKEIVEELDGKLAPVDNAARHMIAVALTRFCVNYSM